MQPGISTHVFLPQRLHPGLLEALHRSGAKTIEISAARHHFDYTDRAAVRDIAAWFRSNDVAATLHQPLYITDRADTQWSRHVAPNLNLIDPEKSRRIAAQDEVKRALENSLTAIEHLKAFAHPLGVRILLENLQNEITTPEHLLEILRVGHFDRVGICLDIGHAHLTQPKDNKGIDEAFELLKPRIAQLHLNDNRGQHDEHLWPGSVTPANEGIDWANVAKHTATLPANIPGILEITHDLEDTPESVTRKSTQTFDLLKRATDELAVNNK